MGGIIDASMEHGMLPIVTPYDLNMEQSSWQILSVYQVVLMHLIVIM